jgi:hypothetical protein
VNRKIALLGAFLCALSACGSSTDEPGAHEGQCEQASARLGQLTCMHAVDDEQAWEKLAQPLEAVDQVRAAKYMVPARRDARLAPLVINSNLYELHYDFMVKAFGELFPGLTGKDYLDLLFDDKRREYYVGSLVEFRDAAGKSSYAFTFITDPNSKDPIDCKAVKSVADVLGERMLGGVELSVLPSDKKQLTELPACKLPMRDPEKAVEYEVYHAAVGFGTVRRYTAKTLPDAVENVEFGFQDIVVLDEAPVDLERVVSGAITGTRQGPLSHLAVRSASRGTPNCYLKGAYDYLAKWEGKLVRAECARDTLLVRAASQEEAEGFWQKLKPAPVKVPAPDLTFADFVDLRELPVESAQDRALDVRRFGAKGTNLAWLRQNLKPELTPEGFVIPMHFYHAFLNGTSWQVDLGQGKGAHTLAETLAVWLKDKAFLSDAKLRRDKLEDLQDAFKAGACDDALMTALSDEIVKVFKSPTEMVRLRSSSNAEDGAFFNGAGLYDSYSGCLADDMDHDDEGPSACDAAKDDERGVCRALKKVWASLWNVKAFEERAFYGIDQAQVTMGVLVNGRSEAEKANMVAFTGNPVQKSDARYLVNAQIDELAVVSPDPGIWPEQSLLTIQDGKVTEIARSGSSSELPEGEHVLSDAQLTELGGYLAEIAKLYPFDQEAPKGRSFILDTEWKVMPDGALRVKQVRPFLK